MVVKGGQGSEEQEDVVFVDVVEMFAEVPVTERELLERLLKVVFVLSEVDIICFTAALRISLAQIRMSSRTFNARLYFS